jgi:hypothetical protein
VVCYLGIAIRIYQNVVGSKITVNNALRVEVADSCSDLAQDLELLFDGQFREMVFKICGERAIVHPRRNHRWKWPKIVTEPEQRQNVFVMQLLPCVKIVKESLTKFGPGIVACDIDP